MAAPALAVPIHPHAIDSLHAIDPIIPPVLSNLDLNRGIAAGAPINVADLLHAKAIARALRGHNDAGDPNVTAAMAEKAKHREDAIAAAHANATYTPIGLVGQLQAINNQLGAMNNQLNGVQNQILGINNLINVQVVAVTNQFNDLIAQNQIFAVMLAHAANTRIIMTNESTNVYRPLYKTVAGSGIVLAQTILPNAQYQVVQPPVVPSVGTLPAAFQSDVSLYTHQDVLNLVIFYNECFGILPGDTLRKRVERFTLFLRSY